HHEGVDFVNHGEGDLEIRKVVVNVDGSEDTFLADIEGGETDIEFSESNPALRTLLAGDYTVSEQDPSENGYNYLGWAIADGEVCPDPTQQVVTLALVQEELLSDGDALATVEPGETTIVCFYSQAVAQVTGVKQLVQEDGEPEGPWNIEL